MKKDIEWLKKWIYEYEDEIGSWLGDKHTGDYFSTRLHGSLSAIKEIREKLNQLDEPEVLSSDWIKYNQLVWRGVNGAEHYVPSRKLYGKLVPKQEEVDRAYRKGFKEGERQTAEYFESITEEPSKEQVWKYLSEHGIEVVDKEPETVADVIADFYKSLERLKEVLGTEVEELEE